MQVLKQKQLEYFVAAAAKNHKRRNLTIGKVKTAVALAPGTQNTVYEVVYLEVIDPQQSTKKNKKVASQIQIKNTEKVSVDSARFHNRSCNIIILWMLSLLLFLPDKQAMLRVKWIDLLTY